MGRSPESMLRRRPDDLTGLPVRCGEYESDYVFGDEVRLGFGKQMSLAYDEAPRGVVTGINVSPAGFIYVVTWEDSRTVSHHFAMELDGVD